MLEKRKVQHHLIRDTLKNNELKIAHLSIDDLPANVLTKGLPTSKHQKCMVLLGLSIEEEVSGLQVKRKC